MAIRPRRPLPPVEVLRSLLQYDSGTGALVWKTDGRNRHAGAAAGGSHRSHGYAVVRVLGVSYKAHRVIWKVVYGSEPDFIDHINRDRSDNRLCNLRESSASLNMANQAVSKRNTSGRRGVTQVRRTGKWQAAFGKKYIGTFATAEEASDAYRAYVEKERGPYLPPVSAVSRVEKGEKGATLRSVTADRNLDQALLMEVLTYDPETGELRWKLPSRGRPAGVLATHRSPSSEGYRSITINGKKYGAHRVAWLLVHGKLPPVVDHINGDRLDNRLSNLRAVCDLQNKANRCLSRNNRSGASGVHFHASTRKWRAVMGKGTRIGEFDTYEEAEAARATAAKEWYGGFLRGDPA